MNNQEFIKEIHKRLIYDRKNGTLIQRDGLKGIKAGVKLGSIDSNGKLQGKLLGKRYQIDHLIWLLEYKEYTKNNIYHINGNNKDNRISNLTINYKDTNKYLELKISTDKKKNITKIIKKVRLNIKKEKTYILRRKRENDRRKENPDLYRRRVRESLFKYHNNNKDDEIYKSKRAIRQILNRCIAQIKANKEYKRTEDNLGYSFKDFKQHIENLFENWMSWDNHGEWHIDHIKPISKFIEEGEFNPKVINALSNLQPLKAIDNISKSNKY